MTGLGRMSRVFYGSVSGSGSKFDTHDFIVKLKECGLDESKAVSISDAFASVFDNRLENCTFKTISKADYERNIYLHKIDLTQLKNDIQQNQKQEIVSALLAHEQLLKELNAGRGKIREKLATLRSEMRLELSLEKGRMRDSIMSTHLKYQDLYSKIDTETSNGYASTGKLRHDIFYSLSGFFFTSAAALLGYLRFYS